MKFSPKGLWRLKPFVEDGEIAEKAYAQNGLIQMGIIASFLLSVIALVLVLAQSDFGWPVVGLAIAASSVTSGLEWNAGLKARALNQLFTNVLMVGLILWAGAGAG